MELIAAERDRGHDECESDIASGRLRLYWQTRGTWGEFMTALMLQRFGIQVIHTSDLTTAAQMSFHFGYNERISEHINSTFGEGTMQTALADVDTFRDRQYRERIVGPPQADGTSPSGRHIDR